MNNAIKALMRVGYMAALRESLVAVAGGDARKALVLDRMLFWSARGKRPDGFIWKSGADISRELFSLVSKSTAGRLLAGLVSDGLLERKNDSDAWNHPHLYRVNVTEVTRRLEVFCRSNSESGADRPAAGSATSVPCVTVIQALDQPAPLLDQGDALSGQGDPLYIDNKHREPPIGNTTTGNPTPSPERPAASHAPEQAPLTPATLEAVRVAVDAALVRELKITVAPAVWENLDREGGTVPAGTFQEVFGDNPRIAWSSDELGYLGTIAGFVRANRPEADLAATTAGFFAGSLQPDAKGFQLVKYWAVYGGRRPTLRAWLALGKQPTDVLEELWALQAVQAAITDIQVVNAANKEEAA